VLDSPKSSQLQLFPLWGQTPPPSLPLSLHPGCVKCGLWEGMEFTINPSEAISGVRNAQAGTVAYLDDVGKCGPHERLPHPFHYNNPGSFGTGVMRRAE
jgi:hypothetical protein